MEIKVLASSSDGNAYVISDGASRLLIECGIPVRELQIKTNFFDPPIDACLISHSHGDHALSVTNLLHRGIPCRMSIETATALRVVDGAMRISGVKLMDHNERFEEGSFVIQPLKMNHDVPCLGFYIWSTVTKESLFFATDTCAIPYRLPSCEYIMVEANYDIDLVNNRIMNGYLPFEMKRRLTHSHMEIGDTIRWLEQQNLQKTRRIYLLHLSSGSSNAPEFKRMVQEATGIPVTIA